MAAQRRIIDQLVSNSNGGIRNDHILADSNQPETDNHLLHTSNIQTIFVPSFANLPENAFT